MTFLSSCTLPRSIFTMQICVPRAYSGTEHITMGLVKHPLSSASNVGNSNEDELKYRSYYTAAFKGPEILLKYIQQLIMLGTCMHIFLFRMQIGFHKADIWPEQNIKRGVKYFVTWTILMVALKVSGNFLEYTVYYSRVLGPKLECSSFGDLSFQDANSYHLTAYRALNASSRNMSNIFYLNTKCKEWQRRCAGVQKSQSNPSLRPLVFKDHLC